VEKEVLCVCLYHCRSSRRLCDRASVVLTTCMGEIFLFFFFFTISFNYFLNILPLSHKSTIDQPYLLIEFTIQQFGSFTGVLVNFLFKCPRSCKFRLICCPVNTTKGNIRCVVSVNVVEAVILSTTSDQKHSNQTKIRSRKCEGGDLYPCDQCCSGLYNMIGVCVLCSVTIAP